MDYEIITMKNDFEFSEMSLKEAKQYYKWYLNKAEKRLPKFITYVKTFPGFKDWKADYSPESLKMLEKWFFQNITTRNLSRKELMALRDSFWEISKKKYSDLDTWVKEMHIDDWTLSAETLSFCFDIGIYFAHVLMKSYPSLKWHLERRGPKNFIFRNRPVVAGFTKKEVFAPFYMMTVQAFKMARKKASGDSLYNLFKIWSGMVEKK